MHIGPVVWTLEAVTCNVGSATIPSAVCLWHQGGTLHQEASLGDGPIDAVFKAIERITDVSVVLKDYRICSVTVGEDAQSEAHIEAEPNGRSITGRAVSTDIIDASALAFLQVINRIESLKAATERILPTQNPPKEMSTNGVTAIPPTIALEQPEHVAGASLPQ